MATEHDTRVDPTTLEMLHRITKADSAAAAARFLFDWLASAPGVQKALLFSVHRQPFELVLDARTDAIPIAVGLRIPFPEGQRFTPRDLAKKFAAAAFESYPLGADNDPEACLLIELAAGDPGRREIERVLDLAKALFPRKETSSSWITVRREVLAEVAKLKNEFLSGVSHELRTPLTLVLGSAYTLVNRKSMPENERAEFLEVILAEAKRLKGVIDSLFEMATLETGKRPIRTELTDLNLLVRRVVAEMTKNHLLDHRNVELHLQASIAKLDLDAGAVRQVLFNLLDNAAKFTRDGGAIVVSTKNDKDEVVLEVKDDGIGIDAKYHDRVFERFFRVESQAHSVPGHGLGLSICQTLIEMHGGKMTLESELGRGSAFRVHLAATQGEAAA